MEPVEVTKVKRILVLHRVANPLIPPPELFSMTGSRPQHGNRLQICGDCETRELCWRRDGGRIGGGDDGKPRRSPAIIEGGSQGHHEAEVRFNV